MARGLWSGAISFGLLNIPIEVMSSKSDRPRISFNLLDKKDNAPIGYKQYNKKTGREVTRKNIVKGYEYEPHNFVLIDAGDFEKANPKSTQTIDIQDFVKLEEVDFLLFEKPYFLVPKKTGEKGYVLLHKVLEETKKVAVAKFVMHNAEHLVCIIPKGPYLILEELRFAHEVQEAEKAEFLDEAKLKKVKVSEREIKMAKELIASMTTKWDPKQYKDTYQDDLMKMINQKIKTGKIEVSEEIEDVKPNTNVVDLMPLLRKSLEGKNHGEKKSHSRKPAKKAHHHTAARA